MSPHEILVVKGTGNEVLRIGVVSVTLPANRVDWVRYTDPLAMMKTEVEAIADQADVTVGLTHLSVSASFQRWEPQLLTDWQSVLRYFCNARLCFKSH